MIRRIMVMGIGLTLMPLAVAIADDMGQGGEVIVIEEEAVIVETVPQPVSAPPPPFVEFESTSFAAGIGARFGEGTLLVGGQEHPFRVKGLSVGDLGISRLTAEGNVLNLEQVSDFAGHYVAVEAAVAAGKGVSTMSMRNEHGVVINLTGDLTGAQLTLGAQGLDVELR